MNNRLPAIVCLLLFAAGFVVIPAWHQSHCGGVCHCANRVRAETEKNHRDHDHSSGHDAAHCPICQIACSPLIIALRPPPPQSQFFAERRLVSLVSAPVLRDPFILPFALAPPA